MLPNSSPRRCSFICHSLLRCSGSPLPAPLSSGQAPWPSFDVHSLPKKWLPIVIWLLNPATILLTWISHFLMTAPFAQAAIFVHRTMVDNFFLVSWHLSLSIFANCQLKWLAKLLGLPMGARSTVSQLPRNRNCRPLSKLDWKLQIYWVIWLELNCLSGQQEG